MQPYKIAFVDSGAGGLQFMLDVYRELKPSLLHLQKHYAIPFIWVHIGDTLYAPYGNQSSQTLKYRSHALIRHAVEKEHADVCMIACNTVSSLYESQEYSSHCRLFPIISRSASHLYEQAVKNAGIGTHVKIGILSTAFTEKSHIYPTLITQMARKNGYDCHIYTHVPESWVAFIETGSLASPAGLQALRQKIQEDIGILTRQGTIIFDAVGLYCTHYPMVQDIIREAFASYGQANVCLISQGAIFAEPLLLHIQKDLAIKSLENSMLPVRHIQTLSKVTGNVALMQSIINQFFPFQQLSCEAITIEKILEEV